MRLKCLRLLSACAFLVLSVPAGAQPKNHALGTPQMVTVSGMSAEDLVASCKRLDEEDKTGDEETMQLADRLVCIEHIKGFLDGYGAAMAAFNRGQEAGFCLPKLATFDQEAKVIVRFGGNHPEALWTGSAVLIFTALRTAYPCRVK